MSLKIKATYQTEVFINKNGYLSIKQGDDVIQLTPDQARAVGRELIAEAKRGSEWWIAFDLED